MLSVCTMCRLLLVVPALAAATAPAPVATAPPPPPPHAPRPHIAFVVADDTGYADVGFTGFATDARTPVLDGLAAAGVVLDNYHVAPVCTPTRSMLMTGRYTHHLGTQHDVIGSGEPFCVPSDEVFLLQRMKALNYSTHAIGKWHLGYAHKLCTPPFRGADTWLGYYNGAEDHYTHSLALETDMAGNTNQSCYFLRNCPRALDISRSNASNVVPTPAFDAVGTYGAFLFTAEAEKQIAEYAVLEKTEAQRETTPFFMYLAYQNNHAPLQVPEHYQAPFKHVKRTARRIFLGMVACLDEAVGNVSKAFDKAGMLPRVLWVFTSDNGGQTRMGGSNYPLRGGKLTLWQGGCRVPAFISGAGVAARGKVAQLAHATDLYPTILEAAGGAAHAAASGALAGLPKDMPQKPHDGFSLWPIALNTSSTTNRTVAVLQYDSLSTLDDDEGSGYAAIIVGELKLILNPFDGTAGWLQDGWFPPESPISMEGTEHFYEVHEQVANITRDIWSGGTPLHDKIYMFNLTADPYERNNIAQEMFSDNSTGVPGGVYMLLYDLLMAAGDGNPQYRPPCFLIDSCSTFDSNSDPRLMQATYNFSGFNGSGMAGAYVPWLEEETFGFGVRKHGAFDGRFGGKRRGGAAERRGGGGSSSTNGTRRRRRSGGRMNTLYANARRGP